MSDHINDHPFPGPWRISAATTLQGRPRLDHGEILRHASGCLLLRCPQCGTQQFAVLAVTTDAAPPTLDGAVTCAAHTCATKPCGCRWTVVHGRTQLLPPADPIPPRKIPDILAAAGVRRPPRG